MSNVFTAEWAMKLITPNQHQSPFRHTHTKRKQRRAALVRVANAIQAGHVSLRPPWVVTITRIGPRKLDEHDNLPRSAKHIVDGIASALGIDDADDAKVKWHYRQERGPYGVHLEIRSEDTGGLSNAAIP